MPQDFIARLSKNEVRNIFIPKDELVFRQDDPMTGIYGEKFGNVEERRFTVPGEFVDLYRTGTDEMFAEADIFSETYHCNAIAITGSTIVKLKKRPSPHGHQSDLEFAMAVTRRFAAQIRHAGSHH